MRLLACVIVFFMSLGIAWSQDTTKFTFEDVDSKPVKRYATQKMLNMVPSRFISIGYEYQAGMDYSQNSVGVLPVIGTTKFNAAQGLRVAVNNPIISKNKLIVNLGTTYWRTSYDRNTRPALNIPLPNSLDQYGAHSFGLNTTIFKPLNEKNFLIFQAQADANIIASSLDKTGGKAITYSGAVIYGWKKTENLMWGLGISRTYRLGRLIHVPVLLYNQTYNDKWGVEALFPARVNLRHNINPKSMLLLGYELEGNQYAIYNNANRASSFLQRGEIKPRVTYEKKLFGFWWLSIQTGIRINGRFVEVNKYNGKETNELVRPTIGNPFYCNISLNLVSL